MPPHDRDDVIVGGAVGLAALLAGKLDVTGRVVAGILSGGNVDAALFGKLIAS